MYAYNIKYAYSTTLYVCMCVTCARTVCIFTYTHIHFVHIYSNKYTIHACVYMYYEGTYTQHTSIVPCMHLL